MLLLRNSADTVILLLMRATCLTIFISKCKLKIYNMPTQMQVTLIKLSKFISSPKILKANQMLISCFPHITVATYHSTLWHNPLGNDMNAHSCKDLKLCTTDQQLNSIWKKTAVTNHPNLKAPLYHSHNYWHTDKLSHSHDRHIDSNRNGYIITISMWYSSCYIIIFWQENNYSRFYVSMFITYFILVTFQFVWF